MFPAEDCGDRCLCSCRSYDTLHFTVDPTLAFTSMLTGRALRIRPLHADLPPAIEFLTAPTIAVTIAPATPPPTACPTRTPTSTLPDAAPCNIGSNAVRSVPPPAPPIAPASVLPSVPRSRFFIEAPAALPPRAPAMIWTMRLMRVTDMSVLLLFGCLLPASPSFEFSSVGG